MTQLQLNPLDKLTMLISNLLEVEKLNLVEKLERMRLNL
jgi:hypothetical protein